jgi:hypothetical protein
MSAPPRLVNVEWWKFSRILESIFHRERKSGKVCRSERLNRDRAPHPFDDLAAATPIINPRPRRESAGLDLRLGLIEVQIAQIPHGQSVVARLSRSPARLQIDEKSGNNLAALVAQPDRATDF